MFFSLRLVAQESTEAKRMSDYLQKASELKYTDWKKSQNFINLANEIADKTNDKSIEASFYKNTADIFNSRDVFDISLKYYNKAYHYYKDNDLQMASKIENAMAIINARLNNKEKALDLFQKVYQYNKNTKNEELTARALNNIGNTYFSYNWKVDSSYIYFSKAAQIASKIKDVDLQIVSNTNLARYFSRKKNINLAEQHFKIADSLLVGSDDSNIKTLVYGEMSMFYADNKKPDLAVKYAEKSKAFSNIKFSFQNRDILRTLYKAYLSANDYKQASHYFVQYDNIRDSLNIEEKAVNVEKVKIEAEYKNKEQNLELENNQKRLKFVIIILVLLMALGILLFFLIRYKNNLIKEKLQKELSVSRENELKLDLEIRNKELVSKTLLEAERIELYDQLHEDLKEISKAESVEELRKQLQYIIFKLNKDSSKNVWEEFNLRFQNVYDSFYDKLQHIHPDLTSSEIKLCAFIKLNLNSKEIADISKTSIKSVENSRTRLRKKLGLTNTKTELHQYLANI